MDRKPQVFPTPEQRTAHDIETARIAAFEAEKAAATLDIYVTARTPEDTPQGHADAVEMMRRRTEEQLNLKRDLGIVKHPDLAEKTNTRKVIQKTKEELDRERTMEQMRLRDEQMRINNENIEKYQHQANNASARNNENPSTRDGLYNPQSQQPVMENNQNNYVPPVNNYVPPTPPAQPPVYNTASYGQNPSNVDPKLIELSQPNYNAPFDVITLPSKGKLYPNKKGSIRLAYMTTADENILTSPNLLQSGKFLEILINRKILEPDLRYKDLHIGDRNAIMLWLRATGYGEMYPVVLEDENGEEFETDINLDDLETKDLGAEPDAEGLFDFKFPLCKAQIKFKLLTCNDIDIIEEMVENDVVNKAIVNNLTTYTMEKTIVEVNGIRDKTMIREFANSMRIKDAKDLSEYIAKIESGIDLNIKVTTPGGGSISTFLPLNLNFFWPNIRL